MILTRDQLNDAFANAGIPLAAWLGAPSIQGDAFATVSREWVARVWVAFIDDLVMNSPELLTRREVGGGKSANVPRYIRAGANCRAHSLLVYAHGMRGLASKAATDGAPLVYDALAWGFMHFTAESRPDNIGRAGRHEQLWFIDHAGLFQSFEGGDGEENEMTSTELASVTFLYAQ